MQGAGGRQRRVDRQQPRLVPRRPAPAGCARSPGRTTARRQPGRSAARRPERRRCSCRPCAGWNGLVRWISPVGAQQPGEGVVAPAQPARQQQPAAAGVAEDAPGLDVHAVAAPLGAGPGGLVLLAEQLERQPDRVAADVVERAALEVGREPDVVGPADLKWKLDWISRSSPMAPSVTQLPDLRHLRLEREDERLPQQRAGLLRDRQHPLGVGELAAQRLLAQHRLAGAQRARWSTRRASSWAAGCTGRRRPGRRSEPGSPRRPASIAVGAGVLLGAGQVAAGHRVGGPAGVPQSGQELARGRYWRCRGCPTGCRGGQRPSSGGRRQPCVVRSSGRVTQRRSWWEISTALTTSCTHRPSSKFPSLPSISPSTSLTKLAVRLA